MSSDDLKKIFDEYIGSTKAYFVSKFQQKYPRLDKKDILQDRAIPKTVLITGRYHES